MARFRPKEGVTFSTGVLTRQEAARRAAVLRDVTYDVEVDARTDAITTATTCRFTLEHDSDLFLDFSPVAEVGVVVDGSAKDMPAQDGRLRLGVLAAGEHVVIASGRVRTTATGTALHRFDDTDGARYLYTHFEQFHAHEVFACFDQPSLRASIALTVHVPDGERAVSAVPGVETSPGTWRFPPTPPIPVYLLPLAIGPWHRVAGSAAGIPHDLWCRRSLREQLDAEAPVLQDLTARGLQHFQDLFRQPYPFAKLDVLFAPQNRYCLENVGLITMGEWALPRAPMPAERQRGRADTWLHEMAHMWFGDLVTIQWWDDLWLKEAFATLAGAGAADAITGLGATDAGFITYWRRGGIEHDLLSTTHPVAADVPDTDAVAQYVDGITYGKGAAALRQLRLLVGQQQFDAAVAEYLSTFAWGAARLDDFITTMDQHTDADVAVWARHWLHRTGCDTLTCHQTGRGIEIRSSDPHRPHRLRTGVLRRSGSKLAAVTTEALSVQGTAVLDVAGAEGDVVVADADGCGYVRLRFTERDLQALRGAIHSVSDPVTRAVIWAALRDTTRDGEMAVQDLLGMLVEEAELDADPVVRAFCLDTAVEAASTWLPPGGRADALHGVHHILLGHVPALGHAPLMAHLAATATSPDEVAALRAAQPRDESPDDHAVAVHAAAFGLAEPAPQDDDVAAAVAAARPTAGAKADAYRLLLDPSTALRRTLAVAAAMAQPLQTDLLGPVLRSAVAEAVAVLSARPAATAAPVAAALLEAVPTSNRLVSELDDAVARAADPPARRCLLEALDAHRRRAHLHAVNV